MLVSFELDPFALKTMVGEQKKDRLLEWNNQEVGSEVWAGDFLCLVKLYVWPVL